MSVIFDYSQIIARCKKLSSTGRAIFQSYNNALLAAINGADKATAFRPVYAMLMDASWISTSPFLDIAVRDVINNDASLLADAYDTAVWNAIFRPLDCDASPTSAGTCYGVVFDDLFISMIERVIRQTIVAAGTGACYYIPINRNITLSNAQSAQVTLPTWTYKVNSVEYVQGSWRTYDEFLDDSLGDVNVYCNVPLFSIRRRKYKGVPISASFVKNPSQYVQSDIWARLEYITQMYSIYQSVLARYVPVRARTVDIVPVSDNLHEVRVNVASPTPHAIKFHVKDLTAKQAIMYYFDMMKLQGVYWVDPLSPLKSVKIEYDIQFPDDALQRTGL